MLVRCPKSYTTIYIHIPLLGLEYFQLFLTYSCRYPIDTLQYFQHRNTGKPHQTSKFLSFSVAKLQINGTASNAVTVARQKMGGSLIGKPFTT